MIGRATTLIDRALELDDASAEAWLARAYLRVIEDPYGMAGALIAFERALALELDNAEIRHQYAQALTGLGRLDQAMDEYRRTLDLEPDRSMTMVSVAAIHARAGELPAALRWADSAVATGPANAYARAYRGMLKILAHDTAAALADVRTAQRVAGDAHTVPVLGGLAYVLALSGHHDEARAHAARARDVARPDGFSPTEALYLSLAALALGDTDTALDDIEAAEPRGAWHWFYLQNPFFDPLRDHPRFRTVELDADPRR